MFQHFFINILFSICFFSYICSIYRHCSTFLLHRSHPPGPTSEALKFHRSEKPRLRHEKRRPKEAIMASKSWAKVARSWGFWGFWVPQCVFVPRKWSQHTWLTCLENIWSFLLTGYGFSANWASNHPSMSVWNQAFFDTCLTSLSYLACYTAVADRWAGFDTLKNQSSNIYPIRSTKYDMSWCIYFWICLNHHFVSSTSVCLYYTFWEESRRVDISRVPNRFNIAMKRLEYISQLPTWPMSGLHHFITLCPI